MIIAPSLILIFGGLLIPLIPEKFRKAVILVLPLITLYCVWNVSVNTSSVNLAGFTLYPFEIHPFTMIFATVFCIAAFAGGLFAIDLLKENSKGIMEISAAYVYAGSAVGATFAGDYITLFLYWEFMAIASTIVVLCGNTARARKAAMRYASMHFFGGVIFIAGIAAYYTIVTNDLRIVPISIDVLNIFNGNDVNPSSIAFLLILCGILINAAAPPFSAWLTDAYPESSPSGAVFLSAFTTKTAVFVLLTIFAGTKILIPIGIFMIFYGIFYAIIENNIRRILSYSIISQVGFMVTGIGIGTELALYGVAAQAFAHIIYKSLLFMSAGSVIYMTGKHKCTELGGLWRSMRLTAIFGIIGALAIAFPFMSGFVSKSLITSGTVKADMIIVWLLLVAASAGVFIQAGIKFPWFVFFQKDSGLRPKDPPRNMRYAMLILSILCILPGIFPQYLYQLLPGEVSYHPNSLGHVITQLQLLFFAGLVFFLMLPLLKHTNTINLDMDWIYRVFLKGMLIHGERAIGYSTKFIVINVKTFMNYVHKMIYNYHGPEGILARGWTISTTVLLATIMLGIYLLYYYINGGY